MMNIFSNQKSPKHNIGKACGKSDVVLISASEGFHALIKWYNDSPPIHVCMPNQPQATIARNMAGIFAPFVPKLALAKTGNGIPYFAPA